MNIYPINIDFAKALENLEFPPKHIKFLENFELDNNGNPSTMSLVDDNSIH